MGWRYCYYCATQTGAAASNSNASVSEYRDAATAQAKLTVAVPAGAQLSVDDEPFPVEGSEQAFMQRGLRRGKEYRHTLKATFVRNGAVETVIRQVVLRAGDDKRVDFNEPSQTDELPMPRRASSITSERAKDANLTITVPKDVKITINDVPTMLSSGKELITAVGLDPDKTATLTVKAVYTLNGEAKSITREVTLRAGDKKELILVVPEGAIAAK